MSSPVLRWLAVRAANLAEVPLNSLSDGSALLYSIVMTRSLTSLSQSCEGGSQGLALLRCLRRCADALHSTLQNHPSVGVTSSGVVGLLSIIRFSPQLWGDEKCGELAQLLDDRLMTLELRQWSPRMLLGAVHAVAKGCPAKANLSFVNDALLCLQYHESRLSEREAATLLWCLSELQLASERPAMWDSLCKRCSLLLPKMNAVGCSTVAQALLLQPNCLCDAQADLLRAVYTAVAEPSGAEESWQPGGGVVRDSSEGRYAITDNLPQNLLSTMLCGTSYAMSEDALLRLVRATWDLSQEASPEVQLLLDKLTRKPTMSERTSIGLLDLLRRHESALSSSSRTSPSTSVIVAARYAALAQLMQCSPAETISPLAIVEALCLEIPCQVFDGGDLGQWSSVGAGATLDAATTRRMLSAQLVAGVRRLQDDILSVSGGELWRWVHVCSYLSTPRKDVAAPADDLASSLGSAAVTNALAKLKEVGHRHLSSLQDNRKASTRLCVEVLVAACNGDGILSSLPASATSKALILPMDLVKQCIVSLQSTPQLTTTDALRLLASLNNTAVEASEIWRPSVYPLQLMLLTHLESHASTDGALREVKQFLCRALQPRDRVAGGGGLRAPDVVLDLYVRLLLREKRRQLSAEQVGLLLQCLEERCRSPADLESAFMLLLTRRMNEELPFLQAVDLPAEDLCRLVVMADILHGLNRGPSSQATSSLILSTLLNEVLERAVPSCETANGIIHAAALLSLPVMAENREQCIQLATSVMDRAAAVLREPSCMWTAEEKAYLIAYLVAGKVTPSEALLAALH